MRRCRARAAQLAVRSTASRTTSGGDGNGGQTSKRHLDVGAECLLHLDRTLGREPVHAAVVDRAKRDAVVVDLRREREHLEPAGVGEHVPVEAHETVQSAERRDGVRARAQHQVVGVREHDLHAELPQVVRGEVLHGPTSADWHEAGSADLAPRRARRRGAGTAVARGHREGDGCADHQRAA